MTTEPMNTTSDSGPFAIIPEWLVVSSLSHGAVRLYALLGLYADWKDGTAWPSRSTLAKHLGVSTDSVDRWIKELEVASALLVTRRPTVADDGQAQNLTNLYTVIRVSRPNVEGGRRVAAGGRDTARGGRTDAPRGGGKGAPVTRTNNEQEPMEQEPITQVFDAWLVATGKDPKRTKLDSRRRTAIRWALSQYPLEDALLAVEGWKNVPFFRGENSANRPYNELTLLFRDATRFEFFRDQAKKAPIPNGPKAWDRLLKHLEVSE